MTRIQVEARDEGRRSCLYCRDAIEAEPVACEGCRATYHAGCLRELGRCGTAGCARSAVEPRDQGSGPATRARNERLPVGRLFVGLALATILLVVLLAAMDRYVMGAELSVPGLAAATWPMLRPVLVALGFAGLLLASLRGGRR